MKAFVFVSRNLLEAEKMKVSSQIFGGITGEYCGELVGNLR